MLLQQQSQFEGLQRAVVELGVQGGVLVLQEGLDPAVLLHPLKQCRSLDRPRLNSTAVLDSGRQVGKDQRSSGERRAMADCGEMRCVKSTASMALRTWRRAGVAAMPE